MGDVSLIEEMNSTRTLGTVPITIGLSYTKTQQARAHALEMEGIESYAAMRNRKDAQSWDCSSFIGSSYTRTASMSTRIGNGRNRKLCIYAGMAKTHKLARH